jgi:Protein of unknown function (DUF3309)
MLTIIVVIVLVLLLLGSFPAWPHSQSWGYGPFGLLLTILLILVILRLVGYIV